MKITDVPYEPDQVVYLILEEDTSTGRDVRLMGWTLSADDAAWWVGRRGMQVWTACPFLNIVPGETEMGGETACLDVASQKTARVVITPRPPSLIARAARWIRRFRSAAYSR